MRTPSEPATLDATARAKAALAQIDDEIELSCTRALVDVIDRLCAFTSTEFAIWWSTGPRRSRRRQGRQATS
ncbi:MAG: hypothetical protein ABI672_11850 [Vicinamibacteria bacterium]